MPLLRRWAQQSLVSRIQHLLDVQGDHTTTSHKTEYALRYCWNCGCEVTPRMSYCGQCGVDLKEEVYVDKTEEAFDRLEDGVEERDDDSRRAPQRSSTAGSTIWHCGECDSRVAERDKFCPHCGAAFVENEE